MANKFILDGATYCGDGTTSAAAASAGAAGAWNTIAILEGSTPAYGVLAVGDIVNIRSKTAGGANLVRNLPSGLLLGSAAPTISTAPVTWILDNGAIWSGINGILSYTPVGDNYGAILRAYNRLIARTQDAIRFITANVWGSKWIALNCQAGSYSRGVMIDAAAWTQGALQIYLSNAIAEDMAVTIGSGDGNGSAIFMAGSYADSQNTVINPMIVRNADTSGKIVGLGAYSGSGSFLVLGGSISGAATDIGMPLVDNGYGGDVTFIGTQIPRTMVLTTALSNKTRINVIGCDADGTGGYLQEGWGWATSRTDNYPPTLNTTLPDAGLTPWAYRVYMPGASASNAMRLPLTKLYVDTPQTKTVTVEVLVATGLTSTKDNLWAYIEYIDATTGITKHLSTKDFSGAASDVSTAAWSSATWGMISFNKVKLSVTTPTTIKQDTLISVIVMGTLKSASVNDVLFIDPDFTVS